MVSYEYDEGETWPIFALTVVILALGTGLLVGGGSQVEERKDEENKGNCTVPGQISIRHTSSDIIQYQSRQKKSKPWISRVTFVLGFVVAAWLAHRIFTAPTDGAISSFDPYELLGVSMRATEKDIKSAYRKLSVKYHPDKLARDLSPQERTILEETYVQITKAYESLTDPLVRENFLKYGHPDGPQPTTHGIALPSFLVEGSGSPLIVLSYILLLGAILPYFVGRWWTRTQSYTRKGIHIQTASYFADRLVNHKPSDIITVDSILEWVSHAFEFQIHYPHLTPEQFYKLLQDHIHRRDSGDMNEVKYGIVTKCHALLHGLLSIATGFRNLEVTLAVSDTFKCIVQAVRDLNHGQILQLPHINAEEYLKNPSNIYTLGKLFTNSDDYIKNLLKIEDEVKLEETLSIASNIPQLRLIEARFVVPGEPCVTPLSTPHFSLKVLISSPKHKIIPRDKFADELLQEPQTFEFQKDPFSIMARQSRIPYTYAPFFPAKRRGAFVCVVVMQKDGKVFQPPMTVDRLDSFENLDISFDKRQFKEIPEDFKPEDWSIGTIKIPLGQPAPPQVGTADFRVIIRSTDYFGPDLDFTMKMEIKDPNTVPEYNQANAGNKNNESNDEDEDGSTENESQESEDDDDSDSESDGDDFTDIDTDTEVEDDVD